MYFTEKPRHSWLWLSLIHISLDPFNSILSLGYSIILNEIYGKIEGKGLNPYFGILHKDREKHPTLASDLMEEWRAVLIDTLAMSMLNGHCLLYTSRCV